MAVYKARDVDAALCRKGFTKDVSGPHIKYHLVNEEGKLTRIWTMTSHNGQEIGDSLLKNMSRQLKISTKQLCRMLECHISGEEYLQMLKNSGILQ